MSRTRHRHVHYPVGPGRPLPHARSRRTRRPPRTPPAAAPFSLDPTNAFEVAISEQIKAIRQDLDRLESRLWWLFAIVIGAAATNVVVGFLGP